MRIPVSSLPLLLSVVLTISCGDSVEQPPAYLTAELDYVGGASCQSCHQEAYELWRGSHHDLAMQEVTPETVLGDFDNTSFTHFGVTTTFSRRGEEFWVNTEGPDGDLEDYRIAYVFGVEPLQQYLIEFPGGRLQALSVCWDTHPVEEGGQRWFHLYPDERIAPEDELHWTRLNQNWNYMCAECHSTDLRKRYDQDSSSYDTTWAEIDVSCEACHGPASRHVAWAEGVEAGDWEETTSDGLILPLVDADDPFWSFDDSGVARRQPRRTSNTQLETCGRCHSRRSVIRDPYVYGQPLLDSHRVSLLEPHLYHQDGQILEEVYVYGSFLQSRMHAEGVTCSDCHDPHSLALWNDGDAACAKCHLPAKYETEAHHRHKVGTRGSACVECHMRAENYMVVDPRHDHSFRVPRPDLSLELGTPNACTDCHRETTPEWAAERFVEWWPERAAKVHYGQALRRGRDGGDTAAAGMVALIEDASSPAIVRATAVQVLAGYLDSSSLGVLETAVRDPDPLVRMAAAGALEALDPAVRLDLGRRLLSDPVLGVRIAAALPLSEVPGQAASAQDLAAAGSVLEEFEQAQRVNADRPEAHLVLGALRAQAGDPEAAEAEYELALELDPRSVAVRVNLADLYRESGREGEALAILREALELAPQNADAHHALGLALVRRGDYDGALESLGRAAELAPTNLRYGYVHAVALQSTGRIPAAIRRLEALHQRWPTNRDVLVALATYYAQMGGFAEAERFAERLVELSPRDPQAQALLAQILSSRR